MPMKLPSRPRRARVRICWYMPSLVSQNHQAEPSWILPGTSSPWKEPIRVPSMSKSEGFRLYRMILGHSSVSVRLESSLLRATLPLVTAIMSKPLSGPSFLNILALGLRRQL